MKNTLCYKGYAARVGFDPDDNIFFGRVVGIRDIVGFHGKTVEELKSDFHNAIDHYLDVCRKRGDPPKKTYSGKLTLRIPPEVHADIAAAAAHSGKSINKWVAETLKEIVEAQ